MAKIAFKATLLAATILTSGALVQPAFAQTDDELISKAADAEEQQYWAAAEGFYRQLIQRHPDQGYLYERLSDIIAAQGRSLEAAEALSKAADLDPDNADLQDRTARAFAAADQPERALDYMNRALEIDSNNQFFLESKAANETWLGHYADAEQTLLDAYAQGLPETEENLLRLAKLQQWQNKLDASLVTLKKVNNLNPKNLEYLVLLTRMYSWRGSYEKALATIDEYQERDGDPLVAAREKAVILAWGDRPEASLAVSKPALAKAPDDVPLLIGQAVAYSRGRNYDQMYATMDRIDQLTGGSDEAAELRRILETPLRSNLDVTFSASTDRDNITFYGGQAIASIALKKPGTFFRFGGEGVEVTAPAFGGLDRIDNVGSITKTSAFGEVELPLSDNAWFRFRAGESFTDFGPNAFMYQAELNVRTDDKTRLVFGANRDFFMISPRAISLGIVNNQYYAVFNHTPNSDWFLQARFEYNDLTDGNRKVLGDATLIRSVVRHSDFNISVGINGQWFGFSQTLSNGYYNPQFYQRYLFPVYFTYKINDDDNLVITVAPGLHKDDTFTGFDFAGSASAELTLGLYRDWMFKAKFGAYIGGGSAISNVTDYWVIAGDARIVRRF